MADFCKQCSIEIFGKDSQDLAGLTSPEEAAQGRFAYTICEGCGPVYLAPDGSCLGGCLDKSHRSPVPEPAQ